MTAGECRIMVSVMQRHSHPWGCDGRVQDTNFLAGDSDAVTVVQGQYRRSPCAHARGSKTRLALASDAIVCRVKHEGLKLLMEESLLIAPMKRGTLAHSMSGR